MPENKITYISRDAEDKANAIKIDIAINTAVEAFLNGEPIDDFLTVINDRYDDFNGWVYDNDAFLNEEYVWLLDASEIFMPEEDIFDYYDEEQLDLKTDKEILEFMRSTIDDKCLDAIAYHYALYKGVYISGSAQCQGQGGMYYSDFSIFKSKEAFLNTYLADIVYSHEGLLTEEAELIAMFKKYVTNKYF